MVQAASASKNIWVAASDGDIERVKYLIENEGLSPNSKDSNSYTPMHAAASYHHFDLLIYLLSVGGDINITDAEGETPLFTVESVEAARWLVEHGADVALENDDGQTVSSLPFPSDGRRGKELKGKAADYLEEDHPEISTYLRSLSCSDPSASAAAGAAPIDAGMEARAERIADREADELMLEAQQIMAEAQRTGEDPGERLRVVVEEAVRRGLSVTNAPGGEGGGGAKRSRTDGGMEE